VEHLAGFDALRRENGVPSPGLLLDRTGLRTAFDWTVELDPDFSDPGESEVLVPPEAKSGSLRPRQASIAVLALESRIPVRSSSSNSLEKSSKVLPQTNEHVLEDLGMHPGAVGSERLDLRELSGLIVVGDAYALLPRFPTLFERGVVELATEAKPLHQLPLLIAGRIQTVLERAPHWILDS
jgi:hypothetical protein